MITTEMKAKRGKCLALVAVLAMVVCAFAIALPAEETDAEVQTTPISGYTELTGNSATINENGNYFVRSNVVVGTNNATTENKATIVLVSGSVKMDSSEKAVNVTLYLAADGSSTAAPTKYYTGLEFKGAANATYTAGEGCIVSTETATTFGISAKVGDAENKSYYPEGKSGVFDLTIDGNAVVVKNGSAMINTKNGADATDVKATISLENVVSTTGITITCGNSGGINGVGGTYTAGSITMVKGVASSLAFTLQNDAVLNAYADGVVTESTEISAEAKPNATKYVYGSVANGTVYDSVTLVNATVAKLTLRTGQVISAENASSDAAIAKDSLKLTSGTLRLVSGDFELPTTSFSVGEKSRLDIGVSASVKFNDSEHTPAPEAKLGDGAVMNVYGKLDSDNAVTVVDEAEKKATFNAYSGAVIGYNITVKTTEFNISGAMQEAVVNGNINSPVVFYQFQIVRVTEDITIAEGVEVKILGKLIVEKDASITIAKDAKLIVGSSNNNTSEVEILGNMEINGTFTVSGGKSVTISGNVDITNRMAIDAKTVLKSGSVVTVEEGAALDVTQGLEVSAGAEVKVDGSLYGTGVRNAGQIVIDGTIEQDVKIEMVGDGAVVDLRSVKFGRDANSFTITDRGLKFADKTEVSADAENMITINKNERDNSPNTIAGLKVVEKVTFYVDDNGEVKYTNKMEISGSLEAAYIAYETFQTDGVDVEQNNNETLTVDENMRMEIAVTAKTGAVVAETLTIGQYVNFINGADSKLFVSGQLNQIEAVSKLTNSGTIDVTGQIKTKTETNLTEPGVINAAMYKAEENGKTYNFYTTLKLAIDSGNKDIKILGTITVEEDISVPAGVTVSGTGAELNIGTEKKRDVTVTVDDGANLKGINLVNVYGTLVFAVDKTGNKSNNIVSDVMTTEGASSKYTNLYKALADAVSGETVTVTGNDVKITQDVTVGEGVTLLIPAGKFVTVGDNVTVTVIGTMDAWEKLKAQTKFADKASGDAGAEASAIKVSGIFKSNAEVKYDYYMIAGAYFTVTTTSATYNFATPVEYAASVSKDVLGGKIDVYGANTVGDVAFAGTATQAVTVTVYGTLKAGMIDLELAALTTSGTDACFSGTVGSDVGAVAFAHAQNFTVKSLMSGETEVVKLSSTGVVCGEENKTLSVSVSAGTVTVDTDGFKAAKMSVADAAKLLVTKDAVAEVDDLTVSGQADATDGGKIKTVNLTVMGTFTVGEADANKGIKAGAVEAKNVFIGIAKKAVLGAAAAFNADTVTGLETVYLAAGSTVTEDLVKDMKKTAYSVDGSEYLTIYAADGKEPAIKDLVKPELAGKEITGWSYVKDGETKVITDQKVGQISAVSAVINTKVYNVMITADYGFADVFIDGEKVASISGGQTVYVNGPVLLAAGTHTVEWKLKNNYSGDITVTFDGKQVSDKKFTIGSDMKFKDVSYALVLTGAVEQAPIQPSADSGDDGMGITDILLIVLVVLIAVMAVMVALRLMRS